MKTVVKGSKGTDVSILQACLRMLHYTGADGKPIRITGTCDDNLVAAINKFQIDEGSYGYTCGNADGSFGPLCWQRLLGV